MKAERGIFKDKHLDGGPFIKVTISCKLVVTCLFVWLVVYKLQNRQTRQKTEIGNLCCFLKPYLTKLG